MAVSDRVREVDDEADLRDVVRQVVAEETADLREELDATKRRNRQLERALATVHRQQSRDVVTQTIFRRTLNRFIEALSEEEIEDYTEFPLSHIGHVKGVQSDINDLLTTVGEHDDALDALGHGKPQGKLDAWQRIVSAAENLEGNSENTVSDFGRYDVVLYWDNIQQATGYSERYCKKLISEFGDEGRKHKKSGVECQDYEPPSAKNDHNARRKRLYIDLDVWSEED